LRIVRSFFGLFLLIQPLGLFISAIFINAVYRPILRPDDKGLFYLKIGGDEWRLFLLFLAWIGVAILGYLALIVAGILIVVVGAIIYGMVAAGAGGASAAGSSLAGRLIGVAVVLGIFCALIWLAVRFSLAAPMTFAQKRVRVFGSWRVTKGRFWSLLGCYVLAWIFGLLIGLVGWIVTLCVGAVITGDWTTVSSVTVNPRAAMMASGIGALTHIFTIAGIVQILLSSLIAAVSRVIMYAPMAAAYRDLAAPEAPAAADAPFRPTGGLVL